MSTSNRYFLVFVTVPDKKTARKLAKVSLKSHLAACANLIPKIESLYWWKGKLETGKETLVLFKTTKDALPQLQTLIQKNHPYECPEFIAIALDSGAKKYFDWIEDCCPLASKNKLHLIK